MITLAISTAEAAQLTAALRSMLTGSASTGHVRTAGGTLQIVRRNGGGGGTLYVNLAQTLIGDLLLAASNTDLRRWERDFERVARQDAGDISNDTFRLFRRTNHPILTSMLACYEFEANGNDSHVKGLHLTPIGTPTFAAALAGSNGVNLVRASSQGYQITNTLLQLGGKKSFAFSVWVKYTTVVNSARIFWLDADNSPTLSSHSAVGGFFFGNQTNLPFGNPTTGVWIHVLGWYDWERHQTGLRINNTFQGVAEFTIPAQVGTNGTLYVGNGQGANFLNGMLDQLMIWDGYVPDEQAANFLYNNGNARRYSEVAQYPF